MKQDSNLDWKQQLNTGRAYLNTAINGLTRPSVFNNALIYQLTAMAIERLLVGVYQYHQQMPVDHTLDGLVDGLSSMCPLEPNLANGIKGISRFDDMCPLIPVNQSVPNDMEIKAMLAIGRQVAGYAEMQVNPNAA
ncbi:MAG: hypothetical protein PVH87_04165 [Desulfobacteraceae bacterium]|jgi:hypothetical protein